MNGRFLQLAPSSIVPCIKPTLRAKSTNPKVAKRVRFSRLGLQGTPKKRQLLHSEF
jgi:hypothetical protein